MGKPSRIAYGQLPIEPGVIWKQIFPTEGAAPSDIRGTRVRIELNNRFNNPLGPGHEVFRAEIDVPK